MFCMSQPSLQTKKGNPVKTTEQMLKFNIDGEYRLLGIDNGNVKERISISKQGDYDISGKMYADASVNRKKHRY